jgi:hypothetical protein
LNNLFHLKITEFFGSQMQEVPEYLDYRTQTYTLLLIGVLSISFAVIAISRMSNSRSIATVILVFFRNTSVDQILKENMRLNSLSSVLLVINYFVSFSLCIFILFNRLFLLEAKWSLVIALSIPFLWFVLEIIGLLMIGWLTGEQKRLETSVINSITGSQFSGLVLTVIALFWIMNPEWNSIFLALFLALLCLKFFTRLLKNSLAVLTAGVPWYYLILYFCTLEILPLFVAYYYLLRNFL